MNNSNIVRNPSISPSPSIPGVLSEQALARIRGVRTQIREGTYETEGKLATAIERLHQDLIGKDIYPRLAEGYAAAQAEIDAE